MDIKAHDRLQLRFFILFILCLQFNNSTLLSFYEGDDAEMVFQYNNLNNTVVSLSVSKSPMFYHSGAMTMGGLTTKQHSRFSVVETPYKGDGSHRTILMVRVRIINVTREDAGTFICVIHQNGEINNMLTQKIGLQVEFPPGKATCEIENSFGEMNGVWVRVHCKAPLGSLHGFIDCYQEGERMPPWTRPVQDRKTLEETLWIKRAHFAHCCTSNYERPTERCSCKDFGWDPIIGILPQDKIDPCGITQVESNNEPTSTTSLGSHSSASNQPYASTTTASEVEDRHTNSISESSTWTVVVTVISVLLMIIVLLVLYLVALRKGLKAAICQVKEKDSKTTQTERNKNSSESDNENNKIVDNENKELVDKKIPTKAYAQALDSDQAAAATTIRNKFTKNRAPQTTV